VSNHTAATLPRELYRAEQVRELDRIAIEERGIPGATLMERAGIAAFEELRTTWRSARRLSVVCGPGNNGGDGFVLARHAAAAGYTVEVALLGDAGRLGGAARTAYDAMVESGLDTQAYSAQILDGADVIVDALFGTGLDRDVEGDRAACRQGGVHRGYERKLRAGARHGHPFGPARRQRAGPRCVRVGCAERELHRSQTGHVHRRGAQFLRADSLRRSGRAGGDLRWRAGVGSARRHGIPERHSR